MIYTMPKNRQNQTILFRDAHIGSKTIKQRKSLALNSDGGYLKDRG